MVEVRIGDQTESLSWESWEQRVAEGRVPEDAHIRFEPVTGDGWVPAGELAMYRSARSRSAATFAAHAARATPPLLTALLLGVQLRLWGLARDAGVARWMERDLTKWTAPILEDGEVWRLVSMGLLHVGFAHILMNGVWFAYTGYHLERALGPRNLAVLFGASVFGGSLASMFGSPDVPSLGASGGIFGLVAACVVFGLLRPEILPDRMRRTFGFALLPYLFLMLVSGATSEGTDNWSHFGGALTGAFLAVLADPPGMDRRPGWSARWHAVTVALMLALSAALWAAGPWLMPLHDDATAAHRARGASRAPSIDPDRPLRYAVPAGWRRGGMLDGHTGFRAPTTDAPMQDDPDPPRRRPTRRGYHVQVLPQSRPTSAEDVLDDRLRRVLDRHTEDGSAPEALGPATPLPPRTIAGAPAVGRTIDVPTSSGTMRWEAWVVARGTESLVVVWEVRTDQAARLAPLRDRLLRAVSWDPPERLAALRVRHEARPDDPRTIRPLATRLAEVGDGPAALALWERRLEADDATEEDAVGWIHTARWYPSVVPDPVPTFARLLASDPDAAVIAEIARAHIDRGDADTARGLLILGWRQQPGHRALRDLRRDLGLSNALDATGVPWPDRWDPVLDRARPVSAPSSSPPTLAHAHALGAAWQQERTAILGRLKAALDRNDTLAAFREVLLWRDGHPAPDAEEARNRATVAVRTVQRLAGTLEIDGDAFADALRREDPEAIAAAVSRDPPPPQR